MNGRDYEGPSSFRSILGAPFFGNSLLHYVLGSEGGLLHGYFGGHAPYRYLHPLGLSGQGFFSSSPGLRR